MRWLALALGVALAPAAARAHGDVHGRIDEASRALARSPDDAALLARRGGLFALDEDWARAADDFARARALAPDDPELAHHLANARLRAGEPGRAEALLDELLEREPDHADAFLLRARAREALGRHADAAEDYASSLAFAREPSPGVWLELSIALERGGRLDDALAALDAAAARLGPLAVLAERALALAGRDRPADARAWIERLPPAVRESPRWRLRRASLLRAEGALPAARAEVRDALAALDALPEARRRAEANVLLRGELEREAAALDAASPRAPVDARWGWLAAVLACFAAAGAWAALTPRRARAASA